MNLKIYSQKILISSKAIPNLQKFDGNGNRLTLKEIKKVVPELKIYEKKSGSKVFDWVIPKEWNIKDAYILNEKKKK